MPVYKHFLLKFVDFPHTPENKLGCVEATYANRTDVSKAELNPRDGKVGVVLTENLEELRNPSLSGPEVPTWNQITVLRKYRLTKT